MLLEIAVGDAAGAVLETCELDLVRRNNRLKYTIEGDDYQPSLIPPGHYTDDTQQAMALAELMLSRETWTTEKVADYFVDAFQRDQRRGYTTGFFFIMSNSHSGKELLSKLRRDSTKSGAAMRSSPVGLYKDIDEVREKSNLQASVTHNSPHGRASALAVALATHYFHHQIGPKKELYDWLNMSWLQDPLVIPVPCEGLDCARAAIHCVVNFTNLRDILWNCINLGGDTDTTAAIAMGIAVCCKEIKNNLPENLIKELENGDFGRDYLIDLDRRLMRDFPQHLHWVG